MLNYVRYGTSDTIVENNSFRSTDRIALSLPVGYTNTEMTATSNHWDATTTSVIDAMMFDKNDDLGPAGFIVYDPIFTAPHAKTPDPTSYLASPLHIW